MISVVILTKNAETTIKRAIRSVSFCDEVIVIDDMSTDQTTKIARELGAIIYEKKLGSNFAESRNFGLTKAKCEWILFLDSDEEISQSLGEEINQETRKSSNHGYYISRLDIFDGKILKYGETGSINLVRLAKKGTGVWKRQVHETWDIQGIIGRLRNPIYHYPHPTIQEFLNDIDTYSTLHARELQREGKRASVFTIMALPMGKFLNNYVIKLGFLDGVPGFIVATMMSFHSFLSQSKLWQLEKTPKS